MKKLLLTGITCIFSVFVCAQTKTKDSSEIESMDEALISAQRMGESRRNTTRQIEVIDSKQISMAQSPTMAELLSQSGLVFVQKSQLGGGSPVLRGFEASRVLMVIDGVRMNNATYRAGHLQDIISIDPFMLDRTELYFGSGSTLYGSDALGGVIYFKTKAPKFSNKLTFNPTAMVRYASASNAYTGNIGWNLGLKNIAWLFNYSYSDFGDLRIGQSKNYSAIDTFGQRPYYATVVNGSDVIHKNDDPFVQKGTGYKQSDVCTKVSIKHGKMISTFNLQLSVAGKIPRYDRLTQIKNNSFRYAVWDYAPQKRNLVSYTLTYNPNAKSNHRLILSNQQTTLGRVVRNFGSNEQLSQIDKVNMAAINYDNLYHFSPKLRLQTGAEVVHNQVKSMASTLNVATNINAESNNTRYADSIAKTTSASVFTNLVYEWIPGDFILNAGLRISGYKGVATFTKNNFWNLDYGSAKISNIAPVFNLGIAKRIITHLMFKANYSTGFRNPNIDDLTKLFESIAGQKYIIPNVNLKPEKNATIDIGLQLTIPKKSNLEAGMYFSRITNLLIDQKASFNGSDSINYGGQMTRVYQMQNAASGYVRGLYFGGKTVIWNKLFADVYYASTFGRYKANSSSVYEPLDHIAPDHGRLGLRWAETNFQAELFMLFNGRKLAKEYSNSGEDNAAQAPNGETPRWETYNIRFFYSPNPKLNFTLGIENILDLNYRVFASGTSAPGRNITSSIRVNF